jgi:hypothetical protein
MLAGPFSEHCRHDDPDQRAGQGTTTLRMTLYLLCRPQSSSASRVTAGFRIPDLHPMGRTTGTVGRAEPFRHDAFAAELASVLEHDIAVVVVMLIEDDCCTPYVLPIISLRCRIQL